MISRILQWLQLLMMFNLFIPCHSFFNEDSGDDGNSGDQTFCPQQKPIIFTVIPRHPYTRNDTGIKNLPYDMINLEMASSVFEQCPCLSNISVEIKVVQNSSQLEKMVGANQTDFGFPVFLPVGSKKVFKKSFFAFTSHPGFDLFIIHKPDDPVQVCIETLLSSWPILALSVTFTGMAGIAIWICETLHNREEFPMSFMRGSWEGFWWAFISMTTVGYGDKCPRSIPGRCFSVVWIIGGLVLVSVFMANVTTALTSANKPFIAPQISEMDVGVLKNSIDERFAKDKGADTKSFTSLEDLIQALAKKDIEGILVDRYVMGYHMTNLTNAWGLTRIKQFAGSMYSVGAVVANEHARQILNSCFPDADQFGYPEQKTKLNQSMAQYGGVFVKKGYLKLKPKPSSNTKSFNLFTEAQDILKKLTLITCCVLAGLVTIGILLDFVALRKRHTTTREHEIKVNNNDELLRDIQKSKVMLKDLQSFLQEIEEKVKKNQPRSSVFMNEAFEKR